MVTLINSFTLRATPDEFERVFKESSEFMRQQPGFLSHCLVRSLTRPDVYVNIAEWESAEAHRSVVASEGFREHIRQLSTVAKADPDLYSVAFSAGDGHG
jgi:heme-degrading monooxygenase HmoA